MTSFTTRREFVAIAPALAMLFGSEHGQPPLPPAALAAGDGELLHVGPTRDPVRIKVSPPTPGRFAMITQEMAPGSRVPIHLHEKEDEIIYIQRGEGRADLDGKSFPLHAGSMLFVPQGTWHGGENTGREVLLWVAIYSPSGFEGYFREIAIPPGAAAPPRRTMEERIALDRRYGIRYPNM